MVEKGLTDLFNRIYYLIKLSFFFWGLTLLGLFIVGIIPAWMSLIEAHREAQWKSSEVYWNKCWDRFKSYIRPGFSLLVLFGMLLTIIFWNLFVSVQINGLIFLIIDFLLFFLGVVCMLTLLIFSGLFVAYEISFWNAIKLSFLQIFIAPKDIFAIVFGIGLLTFLTYQFPGLLIFLSFGMGITIVETSTRKMMRKIDVIF